VRPGAAPAAPAAAPAVPSAVVAQPPAGPAHIAWVPGHARGIEPTAPEPVLGLSPEGLEKLNLSSSRLPTTVVEQYRRLAASLHHAQADRGIKTVMICSALGGEGKSLTATNLALTLSESYRRRVLLVDADLRRPSLSRVFGLPETSGLSDGLYTEDGSRLPVTQLSAYLTLLPAGRPTSDPMASLTSNRMKHIVAEAREAFDWVLLDTPPIALLTDASLLGAMVDSAVLVVRAGRTPLAAVKKAIDTVGRRRVMGVVLNRVESTGASHDYLGYYGSHYGTD
jgi:capsular exopolysaccharide synthesis family protein